MLSVRHATYDSTKRYYENAAALLQMARIQRDNVLVKFSSEWTPVHVVNPGAMLALNQDQPERPDIDSYTRQVFARLIAKRLLVERDVVNIINVSLTIVKFEDDEDIDKKLDEALVTLDRAGVEIRFYA